MVFTGSEKEEEKEEEEVAGKEEEEEEARCLFFLVVVRQSVSQPVLPVSHGVGVEWCCVRVCEEVLQSAVRYCVCLRQCQCV